MAVTRIEEFDTWRPGYGFAMVSVFIAGTDVLALIFSDEALTVPAGNPQTLIEKTVDDISYGKFATPFYTGQPYELSINEVDRTGIVRPPLTTLVGQDASQAIATATGASVAVALADTFARRIDVRDYGDFIPVGEQNASSVTNNNTLVAALGVAGGDGGGYVEIPAGTYQLTSYTIPNGVVIRGQGRGATTLQSTMAGKIATISGPQAGFSRITLDGINQATNSIGVAALMVDQIVFDDVEIKRFDTGIQLIGGSGQAWRELYISDCEIGYQGHGDSLASTTNNGGPLEFNRWDGGLVELCSTVGIELENVDELCDHNTFSGIAFNNNTGIAFHVIGARATTLEDSCSFNGNTTDLQIEDGTPLNKNTDNTVVGFEMQGGSFIGTGANGGAINLSGTLEAIAFRRVEFTNETITLTTPGHNVLAEDCRQISGISFAGTAQAWVANKTYDTGNSSGLTTGNTATKAWGITLAPGQRVLLKATVVARARNNTDSAMFHFVVGAHRPGASLEYDVQTANFTAGNVLTGQTSGATARITADSDSGTFGTLTLQDVVGTFLNDEIITDSGTGSATANGTTTNSDCALNGSVTSLFSSKDDSGWAATFVANGPEVDVNITGDTAMNVEWTVDVKVVSIG